MHVAKTGKELRFLDYPIEYNTEVPKGTYLLRFDDFKAEYYLEDVTDFKIPEIVYGNAEEVAERYLNTFKNIDSNLGILLTGEKGTGKSMLAKLTCVRSDYPIIIIGDAYEGNKFKAFISSLTQECIFFIDEFEKIYHENQEGFLSLLDGAFEGKKLFLFTCNNKGEINRYLLNRPGRIHYLKDYESLEEDIIDDVIERTLVNKEYKKELKDVLIIIGTVTMDIITSLIREVNMYKESPRTAIKHLNIRPESVGFNCKVFVDGKVKSDTYYRNHPLAGEAVEMEYYVKRKDLEILALKKDPINKNDKEVVALEEDYEDWITSKLIIQDSEVEIDGDIINIIGKDVYNEGQKIKFSFSKFTSRIYAF